MKPQEIAINYEKLPPFEDNAFQYRASVLSPADQRAWAVKQLLLIVIMAFGALIVLRLIGTQMIRMPIWSSVAVASMILGIVLGLVRKNLLLGAAIVLGGPLTPLLIALLAQMLDSRVFTVVLSVGGIVALAVLVDRIVFHHGSWIIENPFLERKRYGWYLLRFVYRFGGSRWRLLTGQTQKSRAAEPEEDPKSPRRTELEKDAATEQRFRTYRLVLLLPAVVILLGIWQTLPTVIATIVLPMGAVVYWVWTVGPAPQRRRLLKLASDAMLGWLTYGEGTPSAPGLFISPSGTPRRRFWMTALLLGAFVLTAMPALRYLPVVFLTVPRLEREKFYPIARSQGVVGAFVKAGDGKPALDEPDWNYVAAHAPQGGTGLNEPSLRYQVFFDRKSEAWVLLSIDALRHDIPWAYFSLGAGLILNLFFAPLVLFATLVGACRFALLDASNAIESPEGRDRVANSHAIAPWSRYADRLRSSPVTLERKHFWIGSHTSQDYPVLLDKSILKEHAYIVGDSGSGKTALGLMSLVSQIIRAKDSAVVVLDLKGDNALFQTVRQEALDAGSTFKFFTNELGRHTYAFNPFGQDDVSKLTLNQVCETMLEALNLNHGEGYGRSYFSRVARRWLASMLRQNPSISTFEELYGASEEADNFRDEKERADAFELISVIESLASFEQLNLTPDRSQHAAEAAQNAIRMPDVIAKKEVVYFWLPAAVESASVREIAKLALYSLLRSAYLHNRDKVEKDQSFLVIDEFQRIASSNFKIILEQARSMGIEAILANQTISDLVTPEADLRPTVQTNTRFKQCFSATDLLQQDDIMKASGEASYWLTSVSQNQSGSSTSQQETILPRMLRNDVIRISDDPLCSVVHVSRGSGYTQFGGWSIPVTSGFTMTIDVYKARGGTPWPEDAIGSFRTTRRALDHDAFVNASQRLKAARFLFEEFDQSETPRAVEDGADQTEVPSRRNGTVVLDPTSPKLAKEKRKGFK